MYTFQIRENENVTLKWIWSYCVKVWDAEMMTRQEILFGLISAIFKCGLKTKVIIHKSRGQALIWVRFGFGSGLDLG